MSFDIFARRFERGELASADAAAVLAIVEPWIAERDRSWARVDTAGGDAPRS